MMKLNQEDINEKPQTEKQWEVPTLNIICYEQTLASCCDGSDLGCIGGAS